MSDTLSPPPDWPALLTMRFVREKTSRSAPTIYRMMRKGTFPLGCRVGERSTMWHAAEVWAWMQDVQRIELRAGEKV